MPKKKSGKYVKRVILEERYELSSMGFSLEVEACKFIDKDKVQVKMIRLIKDESSGDAKQFLEPLNELIQQGFTASVLRSELRTL